jgi:uncharacterized membrane protein YhaH (DUF805 family)
VKKCCLCAYTNGEKGSSDPIAIVSVGVFILILAIVLIPSIESEAISNIITTILILVVLYKTWLSVTGRSQLFDNIASYAHKKEWNKSWLWLLFLIAVWPISLTYWISKQKSWTNNAKKFAYLIILVLVANIWLENQQPRKTLPRPNNIPPAKVEPTIPTQPPAPTMAPTKITNTPIPAQTKQPTPTSSETVSQINAVRKAKSYLRISAFSHGGLVEQLEYEKFSHEDAVYGADNAGANWNEQSAKKAKSYMEMSAFSRGGLIEQLKYEKFTQEQAEYGANAVGL